ncbi:MAG: type IV pilus secretin PilQ [Deltaproteobacteria bacterium]|jgi:type IV pilus assembly protein PilQ|nr:type IV pilus secretin PilQ [Deltaproteobacteria bacterium]
MRIQKLGTQIFLAALMVAFLTAIMTVGSASAQFNFSPQPAAAAQTSAQTPRQQPSNQPVAQPEPDVGSSMVIGGAFGMSSGKVYTGQLITLDFQNADIHNILRLIGEVSGKNVVVSDQVTGRVTLKLKDVPWDQALDTVLDSKNLGVIENGNILRIDTKDAIARLTPDISDPTVKVALIKKIFTPKYASVSALATEMDKGKSMRGSVRVIGNDIYVEDDAYTMEAITRIFMRNDSVTNQILIEARIVEASTSVIQTIGVSWGGGFNRVRGGGSNMSVSNTGSYQPGDIQLSSGEGNMVPGEFFGQADLGSAAALGVGFLNKAGTLALSAELHANETMGQIRTVSAPRIMAANDQEVYIKQGTSFPYLSGGTATSVQNVEFKEANMELRVTPHIEENGQIVTLDITLTKDAPGNMTGTSGPEINTREAKTKLMVRDGETVVIGGIINDSQNDNSLRVPGLHRLPLLGWLFQENTLTNEKSELLIFITANILPMTI